MTHFLAKTEPATYSIGDLERDKQTVWDGVTNAQAVRTILEMSPGDRVFIYHSGTEPAVAGLNLQIRSGELIALVGENGAGKSTLVKLLLRFYDPDQGSVRVGGVDLKLVQPLQEQQLKSVGDSTRTWPTVAKAGGIVRHQGPHTNLGWLALMLAMGCLPTGFLTLLLAAIKLIGDHRR